MTSTRTGYVVGYLLALIATIFVVALILYFAYLLITSSDQTRLAVLTATVSIGTLVYTQSKNTKREIQGRQFAKKADAYEEVLTTLNEVIFRESQGNPFDAHELAAKLALIQPKLLVWAGPDVLMAWQRMAKQSDDPLAALTAGNELIAAIRGELGHTSDSKLGTLGLVSMFIKADERPNRADV